MNSQTSDNRRTSLLLLLILLLAALLRILYLYQYHQIPEWDQLTVDNWYHLHWAESIAGGNILGDTTYFRAPFYVYCLALLKAVFGSSLWVGRLFGMAVGLCSIAMTYKLGKQLFDRRIGLIASALHSVYPVIIYFEGELLVDALFTLLVQTAVYRFLIWQERTSASSALLTGLAVGLAAITRPTILLAAPLMIIMSCKKKGRKHRIFRETAFFVLGLLLCVGPVFIRNLTVAGDPVLIASQGGVNLYIGNNDAADGFSAIMPEPLGRNWRISQITHMAETACGETLKPGQVSTYWTSEALDWIRSHPARFISLFTKKVYYQFLNTEVSNNRSLSLFYDAIPILKYNPVSFVFVFPLAVLTVWYAFRQNRGVFFVVLLMALLILTISLFFYTSRFRLPLLPYYLILASSGLTIMLKQYKTNRKKNAFSLIVLIGLGLLSFVPVLPLPSRAPTTTSTARGLYCYTHQDYNTALKHFREVQRHEPDSPEVNLNLGTVYLRMGQTDSARHYFERETALHPQRVKAYYNLASVHLVSGRIALAQHLIGQALEIAPYDVTANRILLRVYAADTSRGISDLKTDVASILISTDSNLYVLNESAITLSQHGIYAEAEHLLELALTAPPPPIETDDFAFDSYFPNSRESMVRERARSHYLLGYLHGIQGHLQKAINHSRSAITGDSTLAEAYVNLASALLSSGQPQQADSVLRIAQRKFLDNPQIRELIRKYEL